MKVSSPHTSTSAPVNVEGDNVAAPFASAPVIKGILPSCFDNLASCQSTTGNCTGHGTCYMKFKGTSKQSSCWTCGCKATVTKNANGGKKTTNWGGSACQKKDISVPFWILAGFTILLVGTISWGIGLLYSMGEEELPSVIGAGVSGPKAK